MLFSTAASYHSLCSRIISSCKDLYSLRRVHAHLLVMGIIQKDYAAMIALVNAYSSFQRTNSARLLFNSVPNPGVILCNSLIRAYTRSSQNEEALQLYHDMSDRNIKPDKYTYTFVLRACTGKLDAEEGMDIHNRIAGEGLELDVYIATGLIDMYSKVGIIGCAKELFDKMLVRDAVTWNAMIAGLSQSEEPREALSLFWKMQLGGIVPNSVSLLNLYPAVCKLVDIKSCRSIHGFVIKKDFRSEVWNGLIDMYSKCGRVKVACSIFNRMRARDDISWGTMMAGYAHNGCFEQVLELFDEMKMETRMVNKVSAVSCAQSASELRDLHTGKEIHCCAIQSQIDSDISVATAIISMYAKCGEVAKAREIFEGLEDKDLVAWSAIIAAFVQGGHLEGAFSLFREMVNEKVKPNSITLMSILPACAEISYMNLGRSIHCYAVKASVDSDVSIGSALVSMYAKSRLFASALGVFQRIKHREIVSWNALINGCAQNGYPYNVMEIFSDLRSSGIKPDAGTMVGLLPACALNHDLNQGTCIHCLIIKNGLESDFHVKNSLIDMYAKCGRWLLAESLINEIGFMKDEVSWNAMIAGYAQNGRSREAIAAFCMMKVEELQPNIISVVSILPAIADLTELKNGMSLHTYVVKKGFTCNKQVGNSLIDMYAKCGCLDCSEQYFSEMEKKDTISWNAMLAGYAMHGQGKQAVELFSKMQEDDIMADSVSFLTVLSACRHAGLVEEGRTIFSMMANKYHLHQKMEHYACMVDLLGRSGLFDEAMGVINGMPMNPDASIWGALLGACRMHSKVDLAEAALDQLVKLEPGSTAHYVGLSHIYADSGRWADARETILKLTDKGLRKEPGRSWF